MGIYRIIVLDYSGKSKYYDPLKEILTVIIINQYCCLKNVLILKTTILNHQLESLHWVKRAKL